MAPSLSGLELLHGLQARGPASVGVADLLGMSIEAVEPGVVVFGLRTGPQFSNPHGTVHGGITATLLDSAMGCAVLSELPPDVGYTTVDLSVTYLRPVPLDGTHLQARGEVLHLGRRIATAQGRVTDGRERLIATATTTCQINPAGSPLRSAPRRPRSPRATTEATPPKEQS
jgi:acyl-CoA thioesterase